MTRSGDTAVAARSVQGGSVMEIGGGLKLSDFKPLVPKEPMGSDSKEVRLSQRRVELPVVMPFGFEPDNKPLPSPNPSWVALGIKEACLSETF